MHHGFDSVIERRHTHSSKWGMTKALFGRDDVLPMWVADTDFPAPEPVVRALRERIEHPIYGYTYPPASLCEAIIDWHARHWGWQIEREWIVFTAGVVNGLHTAVRAVARPGDEVVIQPPVYYPFSAAVRHGGCQVVHNQLILDGGRYRMDIDALRSLFARRTTFPARTPRIKMLILCSPHNPVGRVWTPAELAALAEVCLEYGVVLVSDEIHGDLTLPGHHHTPTAKLSEEIAQQTITLNAASKTFNLAGLATSYAVIPEAGLRRRFQEAQLGAGGGNMLGYVATEAAYREGDPYLAQLRSYLQGNFELFREGARARLPGVEVVQPEGTYLAWADMRGLGMSVERLETFIRNEARLALDDGYAFGPGGEGFQRFNLGCPRSVVEEALRRLEGAIRGLGS